MKYSLIFLFGLLLPVLEICVAESVFDVFRVLQFDKDNLRFGSRRAGVNLPAFVPTQQELEELAEFPEKVNATEGLLSSSNPRRIAVVKLEDLTLKLVKSFAEGHVGQSLLVTIPHNLSSIESAVLDNLREVEVYVLTNSVEYPMLFTMEENASSLLFDSNSPNHYLVVNEKEPTAIKSSNIFSYEARIHGDSAAPFLGVVAHYDTLGMLPSYPSGYGSSSGVTALIELLRLYFRLYSSSRTSGFMNLVFLLSGGGRMNYAGSRAWLQKADTRVLENLDAVVCLENLAGENLFLHVSRPEKDESVKRMHEAFMSSASRNMVNLQLVHRKINASSEERLWEHEVFAYKRIFGVTVSSVETPTIQFARSDLLETSSVQNLVRNIRVVTEALATVIYSYDAKERRDLGEQVNNVFRGNLDINEQHIVSWTNAMKETERVQAFMDKKSSFLSSIKQTMSDYASEVVVHQSVTDPSLKFYGAAKMRMADYTTKGAVFDLLFSLLIMIYILGLYVYMNGVSKSLQMLKGIPNLLSSKKQKTK